MPWAAKFVTSSVCVRPTGSGRWRKLKGIAHIRLEDGTESDAELHWYEAHGIGKQEMKIKALLD